MANPYIVSWRRQRAARRRTQGLADLIASALPLLVLAAAGPLVEPVFMGFLASDDPRVLALGVSGLGLRLALLACGAMSIWTYAALVRGEDRAILDPHPARPAALLRYLTLRLALEKAWLLPAFALFALPVLRAGEPLAWALTLAVAAGGFGGGLLTGFTVHLGSVWAAESPALAGLLELVRGQNPRLQAALIYAPGFALLVGGVGAWGAAEGARLLLEGEALGAAGLALPWVLGGLIWLPGGALAERHHFRATLLLAEIDAAYAANEDPEEARRVYLEWALRLLPPGLRVLTLRELRHGWRGLRAWVTGAWGFGGLALLSAWSSAPDAGARAVVIAGAGLVFIGMVALRLAATDPLWLDQVLPAPRARALVGRAIAVFGWLQGVVLPPALALLIQQGAGAALRFAGSVEALALAVAALGAALSPQRGRALPAYLLLAGLAWLALLLSLGVAPQPALALAPGAAP